MGKTAFTQVTGLTILTVWVVSLLTGLVTHDYTGVQLVTPIMLIFVGYVFGESVFKRKDSNGS